MSTTPPGTFLGSTPPGARILVDGHDSGFVTPSSIDLSGEGRVRVDLELAGYLPARIVLAPHGTTQAVTWRQGAPSKWASLHVPLALEAQDLFAPFKRNGGPHPQRVHIRLRPRTETPDERDEEEPRPDDPAPIELSSAEGANASQAVSTPEPRTPSGT